jgi:hypothetical protein
MAPYLSSPAISSPAELLQNTEFPGINNQSALVGDGSAAACFANGVAAASWT